MPLVTRVDFRDCLGNRILKSGDRLRVRWPDGTSSSVDVKITSTEKTLMRWDRAVPYCIQATEAFALIDFHGIDALVPLLGCEAEFIDHLKAVP